MTIARSRTSRSADRILLIEEPSNIDGSSQRYWKNDNGNHFHRYPQQSDSIVDSLLICRFLYHTFFENFSLLFVDSWNPSFYRRGMFSWQVFGPAGTAFSPKEYPVISSGRTMKYRQFQYKTFQAQHLSRFPESGAQIFMDCISFIECYIHIHSNRLSFRTYSIELMTLF